MKFQQNPTNSINNVGDINRGRIGRGFRHDTTYNTGDLIPVFATHILPNDVLSLDLATLLRTVAPPLRQTMDYLVHDFYAFYVSNHNITNWLLPYRGTLNEFTWTKFMGENKNGQFLIDKNQQQVLPDMFIASPPTTASDFFNKPRLSDYLGQMSALAGVGSTLRVNRLKHLAYRQIWNEYFRDWNFQPEVNCNFNQAEAVDPLGLPAERHPVTGALPIENNKWNQILPVNRLDDYFSRALPAPQKFSGILTTSQAGLPVFAGETFADFLARSNSPNLSSVTQMVGRSRAGDYIPDTVPQPPGPPATRTVNVTTETGVSQSGPLFITGNGYLGPSAGEAPINTTPSFFTNLYAGRINTDWLRELERSYMLFQLYEINSRSPLYSDIIRNHFGVTPSDVSLNRPTFLGHARYRVTPTQVENVGQSENLGDIGAYFKSSNNGRLFSNRHFDDYGILMVLCCVRPHRSYQQGVNYEDIKRFPEQFHKPVMNNLPYQPLYTNEIYNINTISPNILTGQWDIFGWRPAWDEYQFFPDMKTGQFRTYLSDISLDEWHYADWYDTKPMLSSSWLIQSPAEVDRTLSATSIGSNPVCHQFMQETFITLSGKRPVSFHMHEKGRKF